MVDWDGRYRNSDTPWCKGREHPSLVRILDAVLPRDFDGRILVPGCGRGRDVGSIARLHPHATIHAVDVSKAALDDAAAHLGGISQVRLLHGDFLNREWLMDAVGMVDMLWEHTCFCAIDPSLRPSYAASASAVISPGGVLAGVFFLNLDDEGAGPPWNCPENELRDLFGKEFEFEFCRESVDTFDGRQGEEYAVCMRRVGGSPFADVFRKTTGIGP